MGRGLVDHSRETRINSIISGQHIRLDIMMSIPGVDFEIAWSRRVEVQLETTVIPFISRADLIKAKEASGRPQDLVDAENLKKAEQADPVDGKAASDS